MFSILGSKVRKLEVAKFESNYFGIQSEIDQEMGMTNGFQTYINSTIDTPLANLPDEAFQSSLLARVSRTFALTIPQLPGSLHTVVANAYLLCRIVDTIEDEIALDSEQKREFCQKFISVMQDQMDAERFSRELAPLLSNKTIPAEHELIQQIPRVIAITHQFEPIQTDALSSCVKTMAGGMPRFQALDLSHGLATMEDMSRYCYFVAGCVGEMLTKLFCHYSSDIAAHQERLEGLGVSFGQGLQMTNILKDIWDDYERGVCWLPQEVFIPCGYDLKDLVPDHHNEKFREGLENLISIAYGHLQNAMTYTIMMPKRETGIRNFCFWAIGMAVLTLRKIKKNPYFSQSVEVKISRTSVKTTMAVSQLAHVHDGFANFIFHKAGAGLYRPGWDAQIFEIRNS